MDILLLSEIEPNYQKSKDISRIYSAVNFDQCLLLFFFFGLLNQGKNCCLNASTVELFLKNEPQSTSTKNLVHLAQSKLN